MAKADSQIPPFPNDIAQSAYRMEAKKIFPDDHGTLRPGRLLKNAHLLRWRVAARSAYI
jgi:hypothetical protein